MSRPIHEIAAEVRKTWPKVNFAAEPYLAAMECIGSIEEDYGADSARSVVLYFLSNATGWRGEAARRIKAELNSLVSRKPPRSAK